MTIRKATTSDIPAIVELLKLSLGEGMIKKSEKAWRWKHIENPFGESPVLVAEEKGELIGVRAMMRWDFEQNGKVYKALRAVDTATHPAHHGRGIFKQLTLALIEQLKKEGYDFIFNTPNEQSRPGYLKMGWQAQYRIPIRVKTKLALAKGQDKSTFAIDPSKWLNVTEKQRRYLQWRYADNPLAAYHQLTFEGGLAFFRVKEGKYFNELRLCDVVGDGAYAKALQKSLTRAMNSFGARVATVGSYTGNTKRQLDKAGFLPKINKGLGLTTRELCANPLAYFDPMENVDFDLGTYELF